MEVDMKKMLSPMGKHQRFAIMAWVVLLAVFPLTHEGNDPWTVGVVAAQTEITQGMEPPPRFYCPVGHPGLERTVGRTSTREDLANALGAEDRFKDPCNNTKTETIHS